MPRNDFSQLQKREPPETSSTDLGGPTETVGAETLKMELIVDDEERTTQKREDREQQEEKQAEMERTDEDGGGRVVIVMRPEEEKEARTGEDAKSGESERKLISS